MLNWHATELSCCSSWWPELARHGVQVEEQLVFLYCDVWHAVHGPLLGPEKSLKH